MWHKHEFILYKAYYIGPDTFIAAMCALCDKHKGQHFHGVRLDAGAIKQLATGFGWNVTKEIHPW